MRVSRREAMALLAGAAALPGLARAQATGGPPPVPRVMALAQAGRTVGRPGGTLRMVVAGQRDVRLMPIFGYSRLVGYDENLNLVPDILRDIEVEEGRIFTMHLRPGHCWSDGHPFTTKDFRYVWEDMINNKDLYRGGPPTDLKADGVVCTMEIIDEVTLRYSWPVPIPDFLPRLAAPAPVILYAPSHYLRQFHARYQDEATLARLMAEHRQDDWQGLHVSRGRSNRPENPDLPTLEPWRPRTAPPAERFVFERNPHFHRVDETGQQLPYIDRVELHVASAEVVAAKTATGESDLQALGLGFGDYTLMKHAEKSRPLRVALWKRTQGSAVALYPNMTCKDPVWRALFRDVRVRRALSLAIDRRELNAALFYGLGAAAADTVLPESPLYRPDYAAAWTAHDPEQANALLDAAGMERRGAVRYLSDGRKAGIVVETAGESAVETDVLELVKDHWRAIGIDIYIRSTQRDIFRARALAGDVLMGVWAGIDNAVPTADMSPEQLAPTTPEQYQWPVWGMHYSSAESSGEAPDLPEATDLLALLRQWRGSADSAAREAIWHRMLAIRADQVFTIGTVSGALQPLVYSNRLRNLPEHGLWGFEPTSYFGVYSPDTFHLDGEA